VDDNDSQIESLINEQGEPFASAALDRAEMQLSALEYEKRREFRNKNSDAIATHSANRMLIVSGPGTGKSHLFITRVRHWLTAHPSQRISIATFVRKLVLDLRSEIEQLDEQVVSPEDKRRIGVSTLHRLARSIVERNRGTKDLELRSHGLVISEHWEEMVWRDAVSLHANLSMDQYPWFAMQEALYDAEVPTGTNWEVLRETHLALEQFYNALTFADLIVFATRALLENTSLAENTLFIIDEFQDFNLAEEALIQALAAESAGLLLVGDDDQVLYDKRRRAHASIIRRYYNDRSYAKAMLPLCSRCSVHICRAAEHFLNTDRASDSIRKIFLPLNDGKAERVHVVVSTSPKSGIEYLERFIEQHADGIRLREEEIRSGKEKDPYLLILSQARELTFLKPAGDVYDRFTASLGELTGADKRPGADYWKVRDYYFAALDPDQNFNFRKVLYHEDIRQNRITSMLGEVLRDSTPFSQLERSEITVASEHCKEVKSIIESDDGDNEKVAKLMQLLAIENCETLTADLARNPITRSSGVDDASGPDQPLAVAPVQQVTIIGAKGLSADHVVILGCDNANLTYVSRNAFFVALTRAKKSLTIMACIGGGGAKSLHPFVSALPNDHISIHWAAANAKVENLHSLSAVREKLSRWEYAKKIARQKSSKNS
jgi:superfamily I DNA/RNA helicase